MQSSGQGGAPLQHETLAAYVSLTQLSQDWSGRLVLLAASGHAAPYALATLAAGGAVLWSCGHEAGLREGSAQGLLDFHVTTLSEALRILKNEIRKGLPVSVGLLDRDNTVWTEVVERGVQPEAVYPGLAEAAAATTLVERGATLLHIPAGVALHEDRAANWRQRRAVDEALLLSAQQMPGPDRRVALGWLRAVPRLFPRDLLRCYAAAWSASNDADDGHSVG